MRLDQKKVGVLLTFAGESIKILSALLYTPIMLRLLGQSEYGLYQLASSTISYLSILSLGFVNAYFRYYSRYNIHGDTDGVARLNGMFLLVFGFLSSVCVILGAVIVAEAEVIFGSKLSAQEIDQAQIMMLILVVNMATTLFNSVYYCYIMACEQFIFQKLLTVLKNLLGPVLTLPLLYMGMSSVAVVLVTTILTIAVFISNAVYCHKKLNMHFSFKDLQFSQLKEMCAFTFFIFLNQLVSQANWSVDKLLLGRMCGTESVAVYGIGLQIYWLYFDTTIAIPGVFIPQVNNIVAKSNDNLELTDLMVRVGRIQFALAALILIGFGFLGQAFILLWAGPGYSDAYWIALLLMLPMTVPLIQNIGIEVLRAKNKHQIRSIVYTILAVANVCISIFMIKFWGGVGAAVGTMITLVAGEILFINWYYHRKIGLDMVYFWKQIGKMLPAVLVTIAFCCVYQMFVQVDGWGDLVLSILVFSIVYAVCMWFAGLNAYEKQLVRKMLSRIPGLKKL